jgi:hypothetical protein
MANCDLESFIEAAQAQGIDPKPYVEHETYLLPHLLYRITAQPLCLS